jgi:hypothetical protein
VNPRVSVGAIGGEGDVRELLGVTACAKVPPIGSDAWIAALADDAHASRIIESLAKWKESGEDDNALTREQTHYSVAADGVLKFDNLTYVPKVYHTSVLHHYHDELVSGGHMGLARTTAKIRRSLTWPTLDRDAADYIRTCDSCQRFKRTYGMAHGLLRSIERPKAFWHTVGFDLFAMPKTYTWGGEEHAEYYNMVLCVVDYLSAMVILVPTSDTLTSEGLVYLWMAHVFIIAGIPTVVISDRETRALAPAFNKHMKKMGSEHRASTARHQKTNGKIERLIQVIKAMCKNYLKFDGGNWVDLLPLLAFSWNTSTKPSAGLSPFEAVQGSNPWFPTSMGPTDPRPLELPSLEENAAMKKTLSAIADSLQAILTQEQAKQDRVYNSKRRPRTFKPGDKVLLHREGIDAPYLRAKPEKLSAIWIGPFEVVEKGATPNTYRLRLPLQHQRLHPVFHVDSLRLYHQRPGAPEPDPATLVDGYEEWEVEAILQESGSGNSKRYYVQWKGWPMEYATWESAHVVDKCAALDAWEARPKGQKQTDAPEARVLRPRKKTQK